MIKEIQLRGITTTPSDYNCPSGDLIHATGLISEDGSLRTPPSPEHLLSFPSSLKLLCRHTSASTPMYIFFDTSSLKLCHIATTTTGTIDPSDLTYIDHTFSSCPAHIEYIGNTLIVLDGTTPHYILFKQDSYTYIGTNLPELQLQFGLKGQFICSEEFKINFGEGAKTVNDRGGVISSPTALTNINNVIKARLNTFIKKYITDEGHFCHPFLVRYAYRLFDGTYTMHSAPILMYASYGKDGSPLILSNSWFSSGDDTQNHNRIFAVSTELWMNSPAADSQTFADWSDIVKSVDIFISDPIYQYDADKQIDTIDYDADMEESGTNYHLLQTGTFCSIKSFDLDLDIKDATGNLYCNRPRTFYDMWVKEGGPRVMGASDEKYLTGDDAVPSSWSVRWFLPTPKDSSPANHLNFYLLKSYDLNTDAGKEALFAGYNKVDFNPDIISVLATQPQLPDDYQSHDHLQAHNISTFNSRLNLININRTPFAGFPASSVMQYQISDQTAPASVKYFVYLTENGQSRIVQSPASTAFIDTTHLSTYLTMPAQLPLFFFYPNSNATKLIIESTSAAGTTKRYIVKLRPCPLLNGSYAFLGWSPDPLSETTEAPTVNASSVRLPNRIYQSTALNPFHFPATGMSSVGQGTALATAVAVAPVSQGQFGEFPLYALTTEGVWSLQISADGTISRIIPATRDVCTNIRSVTSIDTSVLFATSRGIIELNGSQSACLTDTLKRIAPSCLADTTLPHISSIIPASFGTTYPAQFGTYLDLMQFITDAQIQTDYRNQRLLLHSPSHSFMLLYSIQSKLWTAQPNIYQYLLPSYPDALMVTLPSSGLCQLHNLSADTSTLQSSLTSTLQPSLTSHSSDSISCQSPSLLITRPFSLDDPLNYKIIDQIKLNGVLQRSHAHIILYGSNDLLSWHLISSSTTDRISGFTGSAFRFFRLAVSTSMTPVESLTSFTVSYRQKDANDKLL